MTRRVNNLVCGLVAVAAMFLLPAASDASLISFDSEIGRSTTSASSPAASVSTSTSKARTVADTPVDFESNPDIDAFLSQHSQSSGAGQTTSVSSGISAQCALAENVVLSSPVCMAFRLCETALVLPSPHLEGMLRPPRA